MRIYFAARRAQAKPSVPRSLCEPLVVKTPGLREACDMCRSCMNIAADASLDVIEIDAANNNEVDNIRELW